MAQDPDDEEPKHPPPDRLPLMIFGVISMAACAVVVVTYLRETRKTKTIMDIQAQTMLNQQAIDAGS